MTSRSNRGSGNPRTVRPDSALREAAQLMKDENVGYDDELQAALERISSRRSFWSRLG